MREIQLHNSNLVALVDDEDYERVAQWKWYATRHAGTWYAVSSFGEKRSPMYMHRFVLGLKFWDGTNVDHINGDGLDNRKNNLRFANSSQQMGNVGKHAGNYSSRYKGVYWSKARKKWVANIQKHGKTINLGGFDSEEDAARRYDEAAIEYYGEFARLNLERR